MKQFEIARKLRKNQTPEEHLVRSMVRGQRLGHKFRRQAPIGPYVVDFICFERKLVIEVDGSQHAQCSHDAERDAWFASQGYLVWRFWNVEVRHKLGGVRQAIEEALGRSGV